MGRPTIFLAMLTMTQVKVVELALRFELRIAAKTRTKVTTHKSPFSYGWHVLLSDFAFKVVVYIVVYRRFFRYSTINRVFVVTIIL